MFDPSTVAFEIKYPWKQKPSKWWPNGYRNTFITIWHEDPCKDGSDDSCDWVGWKRPLNEKESAILQAARHMETILDNRPFYPDHEAHLRFQVLKEAISKWRERPKFRIHPRWHFWHWRFQVHPWQIFYRWAFERCSMCKRGFKWNESVCGNWSGTSIWHHKCNHLTMKDNK